MKAKSVRADARDFDADSVRIGDIEVAFLAANRESENTPWVFVHGLGEDSTSWAPQLQEMSRNRPTYAVDVRGHGRTTLGDADGTLRQLSSDLIGFLETIGPSVCVGFSMGGAIVLAAAAQRTDLVLHAICVCTSTVVNSHFAERFRTRALSIHRDGADVARAALTENLNVNVLNKPEYFEDELIARLRAIGEGLGYANGALAMSSLNDQPLTPQLANVGCPVNVLVGEFDASCPQRAADIIVDAVPDGRSHTLPGVGHFVNIEDPELLTSGLIRLENASASVENHL